MSRYIDADELKSYLDICEYCDNCPHKKRDCTSTCTLPEGLTSEWERIIDEQPTINVVSKDGLRKLRDDLYANDQITMKGLAKLNQFMYGVKE